MRVKLTLYYLALLTAVLVFFGVAIYTYLARSLVTIIDTSLASTAQSIERRMRAEEISEDQYMPEHSEQMLVAPQLVQILSEDGTITDEPIPDKTHQLQVDVSELRAINDEQVHFATAKLPNGEQLRIALRRTRDAEGQVFFIRVGQSLSPLQKARRQLVILLALAGPVALLLTVPQVWMKAPAVVYSRIGPFVSHATSRVEAWDAVLATASIETARRCLFMKPPMNSRDGADPGSESPIVPADR